MAKNKKSLALKLCLQLDSTALEHAIADYLEANVTLEVLGVDELAHQIVQKYVKTFIEAVADE